MRRGFVLWSIGLVFALAADGWAGGSALAQAWVPYSPEGGRYNVELPGTPTVSTTPITSPSQQTTLTQAHVNGPGGIYTAGYIDYPERVALAASSDVMLDKVRDGMAAGAVRSGAPRIKAPQQSPQVRVAEGQARHPQGGNDAAQPPRADAAAWPTALSGDPQHRRHLSRL